MATSWRWPTMVIVLALLGACSSDEPVRWNPKVNWENPGVSETQQDLLREECARLAMERAEKDYALGQPDMGAQYGRATSYRDSVDRYDARKYERQLFDRCMRQSGFREATPATATPAEPPPPTQSPKK